LSDEQKARLNAVSPGGTSIAEEDQRALTKFCRERVPAVTDLPFDRIAQATQPTPAQRFALDELKDVSTNAAERLKANCPSYGSHAYRSDRGHGEAARSDARGGVSRTARAHEIL